MDIVAIIPKGHKRPIGRKKLVALSGIHDRKVRRDIETATKRGIIIVNTGDGYFRYLDATDIPYLEAYYRSEMAKGWSIINKCRIIRKFLNKVKKGCQVADNQISIFDYMRDRNV